MNTLTYEEQVQELIDKEVSYCHTQTDYKLIVRHNKNKYSFDTYQRYHVDDTMAYVVMTAANKVLKERGYIANTQGYYDTNCQIRQ